MNFIFLAVTIDKSTGIIWVYRLAYDKLVVRSIKVNRYIIHQCLYTVYLAGNKAVVMIGPCSLCDSIHLLATVISYYVSHIVELIISMALYVGRRNLVKSARRFSVVFRRETSCEKLLARRNDSDT